MKSIWIGTHAIYQYAARIEERDPATLTKEDRIQIINRLRFLYQHSTALSREQLIALGMTGNVKGGQTYYGCAVRSRHKQIAIVLIVAPDDAHNSHAYKLVTVIKVKHRTVKET